MPQPPLWSYLLFEQPWPLIVALAGLWAVLRLLGRRRENARLRWAALAALAPAAGVALLAWGVTTDHEVLLARTEGLVHATEPVNQRVLDATIAPDAAVAVADGPVVGRYRQFRPALERITIARQTLRDVGAGVTGARQGVSEVSLFTMLAEPALGRPIPSRWRLHWREGKDGLWRVQRIEVVTWRGRPADEAARDALETWLN